MRPEGKSIFDVPEAKIERQRKMEGRSSDLKSSSYEQDRQGKRTHVDAERRSESRLSFEKDSSEENADVIQLDVSEHEFRV